MNQTRRQMLKTIAVGAMAAPVILHAKLTEPTLTPAQASCIDMVLKAESMLPQALWDRSVVGHAYMGWNPQRKTHGMWNANTFEDALFRMNAELMISTVAINNDFAHFRYAHTDWICVGSQAALAIITGPNFKACEAIPLRDGFKQIGEFHFKEIRSVRIVPVIQASHEWFNDRFFVGSCPRPDLKDVENGHIVPAIVLDHTSDRQRYGKEYMEYNFRFTPSSAEAVAATL